MKRRWPLALLAGVLLLISGAVVVTLVSARSLKGAVPGKAPLLGLAVASGRYFAASETGLFVSSDGKTWSRPARFAGRPALVTAAGPELAVVLSGDTLFLAEPSGAYHELFDRPTRASAMTFAGDSLYLVRDIRTLMVLPGACLTAAVHSNCSLPGSLAVLRVAGGPGEIIALDATSQEPRLFFAGGLSSGVWRSRSVQAGWQRVLRTPTRAILADDEDPKRIYIGTAGGLLVSQDEGLSWAFTPFRRPVEALSESEGVLFALTADRLVYHSKDGKTWEAPALEGLSSGRSRE